MKPQILEGEVIRQGNGWIIREWYAVDVPDQGAWLARLKRLNQDAAISIAFDLTGQVRDSMGAIIYRVTRQGVIRLIAVATIW